MSSACNMISGKLGKRSQIVKKYCPPVQKGCKVESAMNCHRASGKTVMLKRGRKTVRGNSPGRRSHELAFNLLNGPLRFQPALKFAAGSETTAFCDRIGKLLDQVLWINSIGVEVNFKPGAILSFDH